MGKQSRGEFPAKRGEVPGSRAAAPAGSGKERGFSPGSRAGRGNSSGASGRCWAGRAPGDSTATFATRGGGERHSRAGTSRAGHSWAGKRRAGAHSAAAAPPLTRGQGGGQRPAGGSYLCRRRRSRSHGVRGTKLTLESLPWVGRERRRAKGKVAPALPAAAGAPRGGGRSGGSARGGRSASFELRWAPPPRRHSEAC